MSDIIEITKDEYYKLLCAEEELTLLQFGGVDNWDWYGESLYGDDLEQNLDQLKEAIHKFVYGEEGN